MTVCPRCHNANLVKTIFGSFKCPECLYDGSRRKLKQNLFGGQKARKSGEMGSKKSRKRSDKKQEAELTPIAPQYPGEDTAKLLEIITLRKGGRAAQLAAIRSLREGSDPRVIEMLSTLSNHPDMDFRRCAQETIESI